MLYFENSWCESCSRRLGYLPDIGLLSSVEEDGVFWIAAANPDFPYRFCANWEAYACNWMVPARGSQAFCPACRHNRQIPDISEPENHRLWQKLEVAKRRLFYSLIKLRLPLPTEGSGDPEPLVFQFLTDSDGPVITGHDNGVITISLAEANDAERERTRALMGERYRTLLGHFRHEVGHYYWDKLVRDGGMVESFRALFGDEREDYQEALDRHYAEGPDNDCAWQQGFVSSYATSHPWEDWAETWAHYLHIVDTLEMAAAFGIKVRPDVSDDPDLEIEIDFDPHHVRHLSTLIEAWLPLSYAVNSLNRSMGQPDLYPFVLAPRAIEKLGYIHDLIHGFDAVHR
jgi:hypothetical protein